MSPEIQNGIVLLFVAAAAVYVVVRLRRVASGQSKCACGTKACGAAAPCCGGKDQEPAAGGLPIVQAGCNQGGCGRGQG